MIRLDSKQKTLAEKLIGRFVIAGCDPVCIGASTPTFFSYFTNRGLTAYIGRAEGWTWRQSKIQSSLIRLGFKQENILIGGRDFSTFTKDEIRFLMATNPGEDYRNQFLDAQAIIETFRPMDKADRFFIADYCLTNEANRTPEMIERFNGLCKVA